MPKSLIGLLLPTFLSHLVALAERSTSACFASAKKLLVAAAAAAPPQLAAALPPLTLAQFHISSHLLGHSQNSHLSISSALQSPRKPEITCFPSFGNTVLTILQVSSVNGGDSTPPFTWSTAQSLSVSVVWNSSTGTQVVQKSPFWDTFGMQVFGFEMHFLHYLSSGFWMGKFFILVLSIDGASGSGQILEA